MTIDISVVISESEHVAFLSFIVKSRQRFDNVWSLVWCAYANFLLWIGVFLVDKTQAKSPLIERSTFLFHSGLNAASKLVLSAYMALCRASSRLFSQIVHRVLFWLLTPSPTPTPVVLVLPTITNRAQLVRFFFWQCLGHIAIRIVIILVFIIWSLRKHGHNSHNVKEFSSVLIPQLSWWLSGKESAGRAGDRGDADSLYGLGRCPGGGYGNPLQYSCQGNTMGRGAWLATVHGVAKSWTWLIWLTTHMYIDTKYNWSMSVKSHQSYPTLWTLWTVALKALLSMGFSRQEYWNGLPFA